MNSTPPYDLIIGLDRSDKKADLCLIDNCTGQRRSIVIDAAPEGALGMAAPTAAATSGRPRGPVPRTTRRLHGSRSTKLLEERFALVARAVPVTDECAVIESFGLRVQLICRQLQLVQRSLGEFDRQIAAAYAAHPDREIFASLPGAGPVFQPRLLASLGSQRERFASAASLQQYTGVAPVTKRSGGSCYIHRRYLCPKFHR